VYPPNAGLSLEKDSMSPRDTDLGTLAVDLDVERFGPLQTVD
jgi:hypothetical protein